MIKFLVFGVFYLNTYLCDLNVVHQWDKIDLTIQENDRNKFNNSYKPENNLVHRMKIWDNTLYMAIPRFRQGVPVTLCRSYEGTVQPYPSLGLQVVGDCIGMQNVKDIEIDHLGQLWILDVGKVYDLETTVSYSCDPKLVVVDLNTGILVRSAVLPNNMFTTQSVLSGISLDLKSLTAVIADIGPDPGFIVYNLQIGIYQKFPCKMLSKDNKDYNEALLTVSPIDNLLYFTTVELDSLYTIPLSVFDAPFTHDISRHVNSQGVKSDTSTAMIMDTTGNLYLGLTRKVIAWNTLKNNFDVKELYIQEVRLEWISSFAFDTNGYLWIITSAFKDFLAAPKPTDLKIFKRYCGTTSFALQGLENSTYTTISMYSSANTKTAISVFCILALVTLQITY